METLRHKIRQGASAQLYMKILLTGFNPFAGLKMNPSQLIVEEIVLRAKGLSDIELIGEVLPTEFEAAGNRIQELIHSIMPEIILSLGVSSRQNELHLERVALNIDDSSLPDNAGFSPEEKPIVNNGPLTYVSNMPLYYFKTELQKKGVPVKISNYAGTYVCNHVFYLALHQINKSYIDTICGFIHVPLIAKNGIPMGPHKITFNRLVEAIEYCLALLVKKDTASF